VVAILGGLGAALAWGLASAAASRSTRIIGPASALGWAMLLGLVITLPFVALAGIPDLDGANIAWLAVAGVGNMAGLLLQYAGLKVGKVGVVTPIAATSGGIAAIIAVLAGEEVAPGVGVALGILAVGVVLAARARGGAEPSMRRVGPGVLFGVAAALVWGVAIYAGGRLSDELPLAWVLASTRVVGVTLVTLPFAVTGRLQLKRVVIPFLIVSGVGEVAGYASFLAGARDAIAVSSVLASQAAAVATLIAFVAFGERLARIQVAGVVTIMVGVALLAVLQA
jgi:drug/metabolite transporter (DMT)-like permease